MLLGWLKLIVYFTSNLSERGIFCCVTGTACGTTCPNGEPTVDGSGPNNVGTKWPGAKYGLYVLAGIPVKYGFVAYLNGKQWKETCKRKSKTVVVSAAMQDQSIYEVTVIIK